MSSQGFLGSLQGRGRDDQVRMAHGLDLNFPPPDQNAGEVGIFLGPSVLDQMQAAEHGQLQPQSMDNVRPIDDEMSIMSPTVFSEVRKNRLRDLLETRMTNNNVGVYHGFGHMNEFIEVNHTYGHMDLSADMQLQLYHFYENSGMVPFLPPFPKRRRTGPHPSDIHANLRVNRTMKAREEPQGEALLTEATLNCPICLCGLREETSTKCGHIFCKQCIKEAIIAQHKCPTCRRKLKKNDTIRIYLPRSTA